MAPFNLLNLLGLAGGNRNMLQNVSANAGGVPPLDPAVNVGPSPVVASPNMLSAVAGPTPQEMPMQEVAAGGGRPSDFSFLTPDRKQFLQDMFIGWAAGATPQQSLSLGAAQAAKGSGQRKDQNATLDWLKGRGVSESDARMLSSNPTALNEYVQSIYQKPKNELINAGGSLYNQQTGEWITPPAGAGKQTEYGLNLVYGKDDQGNTVAFQLSKEGTYKPFVPPNGVQLTPGVSQVDTGTGTILLNNKTGEQVGAIQKDVSGAAQAAQGGKNTAEAVTALPSAETAADVAVKTIDDLATDPYLPNMLGPVDSRLPNLTSDAARVQGKMDQLQGQAFLQAFNSLKGGGAITEVEGLKAEQAIARLNAAQDDKDYLSALNDLKQIVERGRQNARAKAQGANAPVTSNAPSPGPPQAGMVQDGYRFKGGDPSDPANWEKQ